MQRLVTGALPLNTMARTLGYNIAEATAGRVVVTADPSGDHLILREPCMAASRQHCSIPVWDLQFIYNWKGLQLNDTGIQDLPSAINKARDGSNKS